ncbi:MAG: TldD/PmbA family protein, partial [Spirochaetota bacterium]|nr:TldD/PmbA family protein [Spirochaetota bacterium]
ADIVVDSFRTDFRINPATVPLSDKVNLMKRYNDTILNTKNIQTSRVTYRDSLNRSYFANSEGSLIDSEKVFTGISLFAMARDGMNVQRGYYTDAGYHGYEVAEGREEQCEEVCKAAVDLLSADSFEKGTYNVLLDPRMTGVFAHEAFGHLSEADFIYENQDMRKMMSLNREFGINKLNIIDDATIKGLAGYLPYDDEGVRGRRKHLIKNGKLHSRLHSRETAFQLDEELTGNARALTPLYSPIVRMTNTFIDQGDSSTEQLLDQMGDGVYCVDYLGGMTNLEMFTFTAGRAFEVRNGKIGRLLRDVVLTGNVFHTLQNIIGIGSDLQHFGGLGGCGKGGQNGLPVTVGGPHVLVKDVVIGGK